MERAVVGIIAGRIEDLAPGLILSQCGRGSTDVLEHDVVVPVVMLTQNSIQPHPIDCAPCRDCQVARDERRPHGNYEILHHLDLTAFRVLGRQMSQGSGRKRIRLPSEIEVGDSIGELLRYIPIVPKGTARRSWHLSQTVYEKCKRRVGPPGFEPGILARESIPSIRRVRATS